MCGRKLHPATPNGRGGWIMIFVSTPPFCMTLNVRRKHLTLFTVCVHAVEESRESALWLPLLHTMIQWVFIRQFPLSASRSSWPEVKYHAFHAVRKYNNNLVTGNRQKFTHRPAVPKFMALFCWLIKMSASNGQFVAIYLALVRPGRRPFRFPTLRFLRPHRRHHHKHATCQRENDYYMHVCSIFDRSHCSVSTVYVRKTDSAMRKINRPSGKLENAVQWQSPPHTLSFSNLVNQSINQPINQWTINEQSINQSINQSLTQSIKQSINQ